MGRPIWHDAGILIAGISKIERSHPMAPPPPAVRGLLFAACYPRLLEWRSRALVGDFRAKGGNQLPGNRASERPSLYIQSVNGQPLKYTPRKPNMRNETCEA